MYIANEKKSDKSFEFEWASDDTFYIIKDGVKEIANPNDFEIVEVDDKGKEFKKYLIIFGEMTFFEQEFDGKYEAHVHSITEIMLVDADKADTIAEEVIGAGRNDAYLIPQMYKGNIVWNS